jgi:hypothetical protein
VLMSSYQYESRSLVLTSILLPSETKVEMRTPLPSAESRIAIPTAPLGVRQTQILARPYD